MLDLLFGSHVAEKVLLYLHSYESGYAREIARTFDIRVNQVSQQLVKFADAGFLVSRTAGRTRLYEWNPRNPLVGPLRQFLADALVLLPESQREAYYQQRTRPRTRNKPVIPV